MKKTVFFFGILFSIGYSQVNFIHQPVAATDDPLAIKFNPAGLAFHDQSETMMLGNVSSDGFQKDFAFLSQDGPGGFGYEWNSGSGENIWSIAMGTKLSQSQSLGLSYSFKDAKWKSGGLNIGWMYRPLTYLSLGAHLKDAWSGIDDLKNLNTGLAVQNKTGRYGAAMDWLFEFDDTGEEVIVNEQNIASIFIEPIRGIRLSGFYDLNQGEEQYGVSLGFTLKNFGLESYADPDQKTSQTVVFRQSDNPYRSILKKLLKGKKQTYVRMKLDGLFIEEPEMKKPKFSFDFNIPFLGGYKTVYGKQLKKFIDEMKILTEDRNIHGMIIDLGIVRGGFSKLSEIRNALQKFSDAGKKIIVYSKFGLMNKDVYLLSMADEIYIHEQMGVGLKGLNMEITFLRGLLDTLSIVPEVWRISPYKTAGDAFINKTTSNEMRENYTQLLSDIYNEFISGIAEGKGWSEEHTRDVIDGGPYFLSKDAQEKDLISGVKYPDEFEKFVENINDKKIEIIKYKDLDWSTPYEYAWVPDKEKIAVIYAVGGIVPGKSQPSPSGSKVMGDKTISEAIKQAREDKSIKAIILRIDSGGGSALASDIMWSEVLKTTETDSANIKPFIASMSSVAACGGYYIACQADSIIAYPSTITGSIGVIGLRLNFSELMERFGIHTDNIKLGEHADFASGSRLSSEKENKQIMKSIQDIYDKFKERVVKGREQIDNPDDLDEIALGRVWTGTQAGENGLIDYTGGYYEAVELAKASAGIEGEVEIVEYPKRSQKSKMKFLFGADTKINIIPDKILDTIYFSEIVPVLESDQNQMIIPVKIVIK